jgi:Endosomal/lysosomal potassium channel TMEM175
VETTVLRGNKLLGFEMFSDNNYSDYVNSWMTTKRIETLVDGIFAISMTLLVLSICIPSISGNVSEQLSNNK